jgi:hypothetical protein
MVSAILSCSFSAGMTIVRLFSALEGVITYRRRRPLSTVGTSPATLGDQNPANNIGPVNQVNATALHSGN